MKINKVLDALIYLYFIFFGIGVSVMAGGSFLQTVYWKLYEENDLFEMQKENIPALMASVALFLVLAYFVYGRSVQKAKLIQNNADSHKRIGLVGILALCAAAAFGIFLIIVCHAHAVNDARTLDEITAAFMAGDFSSMLSPGAYIEAHPYQVGYMVLTQALYLLVGPSNWVIYQLLNVAVIVVTVFLLYQISWELFESKAQRELMAFMMLICWFLFLYTTHIYNDIYSLAPQFAAIYFAIRYLKQDAEDDETDNKGIGVRIFGPGYREAVLCALCAAPACVLKTNCVITVIAIALTLCIACVREWKRNKTNRRRIYSSIQKLAFAAMLFIAVTVLQKGVYAGYAHAAGLREMPKGMPNITYVAMGLQEMEGKYGWYDGFNYRVYIDNGCDQKKTTQACFEDMQKSLERFQSSKRYAVRFFLGKYLSQWSDESMFSLKNLEECGRREPNRPEIADWITYGTGRSIIAWVMNVYHAVLSLGIVAYSAMVIFGKKRISEGEALIVMFIVGGMIFHEFWEASSRYVFRYELLMLPLAAYAYARIFDSIRARLVRN